MTVTRWPQATHRDTCPYRLVPVPPPCGWVQSRSVSSRMCRVVRFSAWGTEAVESTPTPGRVGSSARSIECVHVPSRCRRIVVLLCAALLCVGALPLSAAHAQGAGDQQYSDPFGDSDSGSSNSDDNSSGSGSGSDSGSSSDPEPL